MSLLSYNELVAEGEKRQINQKNERNGSLCPDKKALQDYYLTKDDVEDETKEERIARIIGEYKAQREKEKNTSSSTTAKG